MGNAQGANVPFQPDARHAKVERLLNQAQGLLRIDDLLEAEIDAILLSASEREVAGA